MKSGLLFAGRFVAVLSAMTLASSFVGQLAAAELQSPPATGNSRSNLLPGCEPLLPGSKWLSCPISFNGNWRRPGDAPPETPESLAKHCQALVNELFPAPSIAVVVVPCTALTDTRRPYPRHPTPEMVTAGVVHYRPRARYSFTVEVPPPSLWPRPPYDDPDEGSPASIFALGISPAVASHQSRMILGGGIEMPVDFLPPPAPLAMLKSPSPATTIWWPEPPRALPPEMLAEDWYLQRVRYGSLTIIPSASDESARHARGSHTP